MKRVPDRLRNRLAAAAVVAAIGVSATPALSQGRDVQGLIDRIDRLQNELTTLQQQVYRDGAQPPAGSPGGAQPAPPPSAADTRITARIDVRLTGLENEVRGLTGRVEELDHNLQRLTDRVEKLVSDVDFRLRALEQGGVAARPAQGQPAQVAAQPPQTAVAPPQPGTPPATRGPGAPEGTLGTISPDDLNAVKSATATPAAPAATPPSGTPKEQYERATQLLQRSEVDAAETAFRDFLKAYPNDKLAGNAQYWLGETYYLRRDYQRAAFTFAEGFERFPKGNKAPDNLLKLGMSLAQLGKTKEACTAFSRLEDGYPDAAPTLKRRLAAQRRQYKCP